MNREQRAMMAKLINAGEMFCESDTWDGHKGTHAGPDGRPYCSEHCPLLIVVTATHREAQNYLHDRRLDPRAPWLRIVRDEEQLRGHEAPAGSR